MNNDELREKLNDLAFKYAGGIKGDYHEADEILQLIDPYMRQQTARAELEGQQKLINIIPLFGDEISQLKWFADKIGEIQGQLKDLDISKGEMK